MRFKASIINTQLDASCSGAFTGFFLYVGFLRRLYANCTGTPTKNSMWWWNQKMQMPLRGPGPSSYSSCVRRAHELAHSL